MEELTTIRNLEAFLKGVAEKKDYSKGLLLDLWNNWIDAERAKALAMALQSGQCPQGMMIYLGYNQLGDEGAKVLAKALQSGQCLHGLQLNLNNNQVGVEGAKALSMAIQSGKSPQRLLLNLSYNQIGVEGVKALAMMLQSGRCPQVFQLDLFGNELGVEGTKALVMALQSGQCPQGLQLNLDWNQLGVEDKKILKAAWAIYYTHQRDNFINCMTLHQGHDQVDSPINLLPSEILQEICQYVLPATPILAKMIEISAKVFRAQIAALKLADISIHAKQFNEALEAALLFKRFTEKAAKVKMAIYDFLPQELESMETKKIIQSPTVTLLCKYHLLTKNCVHQSLDQLDHFHLNELAFKN